MYYGKGSQRSIDILGDCSSEHFIFDYQKRKPISDAMVYIRDYLMSDEPLLGGQGIFINRHITKNKTAILLDRRDETERLFNQGELAIKETPLGACTSTKKCDSKISLAFTACITCSSSILKPSKIEKFVNEIEISIKNLPIDSIEYRLEKSQLEDLHRLQEKIYHQ